MASTADEGQVHAGQGMARIMRLLHYTAEPFKLNRERKYGADSFKPCGLWVSVEGDDDWKQWCESEEYNIAALRCVSVLTLNESSNVLLIDTLKKIDAFNRQYGSATNSKHETREVRWGEVKEQYDGMIIAPYQWARRYDLMWYYSWDCASGVLWNLSAIDQITAVEDTCSQPE